MPRMIKIQEALGMDPGELIPAISGTIKTVMAHKTGENNFGPWSIQFLRITDSSGRDIKVKVGNRDEIPKSAKGETIYLEAGKDEHGNLVDLKRIDETYKGNTEAVVDLRNRATMEIVGQSVDHGQAPAQGDAPQEAPETFEGANHTTPPPSTSQGGNQAAPRPPQSQTAQADREAKIAAAKLKNLCVLARKAAVQARGELKALGIEIEEGGVQAMASSIYIQLTREGHQGRISHHPFEFKS